MAQTTNTNNYPYMKSVQHHIPNGAAALTFSLNTTSLNNVILVAKFDYQSKEAHELDLKKSERLILLDNSKNWWLVRKMDSDQTGYVPSNYVKKEKKSLLEKIMPRKLQQISNTIDLKTNAHPQIQTSQHISPNGSMFQLNTTTITTTLGSPSNNKNETYSNNVYLSKATVKHKYTANKYVFKCIFCNYI